MGIIRNLRTENISPQFQAVYDDFFETVHSSADQEPKVWPELITFQRFRSEVDDKEYIPELKDECLSDSEVAARREKEQDILLISE